MKIIKKGFTLLELLMVIMVIAILIGIALPRFRGMVEEGNVAKAKGELRTLQIAVESYYMHNNNTYPTTAIALTTLTTQTPQIVGILPTDPFVSPAASYGYINGGTNNKYYAIWSVGPGTAGSITAITGSTLSESNGSSCIYVSNAGQDTQP
jgi:general secretion pathway protein G